MLRLFHYPYIYQAKIIIFFLSYRSLWFHYFYWMPCFLLEPSKSWKACIHLDLILKVDLSEEWKRFLIGVILLFGNYKARECASLNLFYKFGTIVNINTSFIAISWEVTIFVYNNENAWINKHQKLQHDKYSGSLRAFTRYTMNITSLKKT